VVVCFALFCSLAVALTLVPVLSSTVLSKKPGLGSPWTRRLYLMGEKALSRLEDFYGGLVRRALRYPWLTIALSALLLASTLLLIPSIGYELMPETDEGRLDITVELPVGTPLERTVPVMREIEDRVLSVLEPGELEHVMTVAGPPRAWRPGSADQGTLELTLVSLSERKRSLEEIASAIRPHLAQIPGVEYQVRPGSSNILMRIMRGGGDRLSVDIRGFDLATADRM